MGMPEEITLHKEDGTEEKLPTKWVKCTSCDGKGTSSAYLGAFTRDDIDEVGSDWWEDYMAGSFDRACEHCGGKGLERQLDKENCTPEQIEAYSKQQDDLEAMRAEQYSEWLHEGGWQELGWR
jgi:DnaJ-class molecular chaperone